MVYHRLTNILSKQSSIEQLLVNSMGDFNAHQPLWQYNGGTATKGREIGQISYSKLGVLSEPTPTDSTTSPDITLANPDLLPITNCEVNLLLQIIY